MESTKELKLYVPIALGLFALYITSIIKLIILYSVRDKGINLKLLYQICFYAIITNIHY